jgi:transposase
LGKKLDKQFSKWTLIRLLQLHLFTWRRVAKSLESQRDEVMFQFFKHELALLRQEQKAEKIKLWYYDESGFNLNPTAMYAWLPAKQTLKLPAQRGNILTVAGFLSDDNTLQAYAHQGSTTSQHFIKYVDDFIKQYPPKMKTIILVDNASFHKSAQVKAKFKEWKSQNIFLQFLPPYSSELNPIENLWHHAKHLWLNIEDYSDANTLRNAVINIFKNVGIKYTINFA